MHLDLNGFWAYNKGNISKQISSKRMQFMMTNNVEKQPGSSAKLVILKNYINENLLDKEREFALAVLPFIGQPYRIVEQIEQFEQFRTLVELFTYEKWKNFSGCDYMATPEVPAHRFNKHGKLKEDYVTELLQNQRDACNKNQFPFLLNGLTHKILNAPKEVVGTSFLSFTSEVYGTSGIVYRRLCQANVKGKPYLVMVDSRIYGNSTKAVTDVKILVNGKKEGVYYAGRLDSVGFMDEKFLNKHGIAYSMPKDIEQQARLEHDHFNYFNIKKGNALPENIKSNNHYHVIDNDFELMKGILAYYAHLVPVDQMAQQNYEKFKTKMNAKPFDFYHDSTEHPLDYKDNEAAKRADAEIWKGVIPLKRMVQKVDKMLGISSSPEFVLDDKTYEFIDNGRDPSVDTDLSTETILRMDHFAKTGDLVM